ncbi:MAG: hypothetical protein ACP5N2_04055 [Candidatus Nanoarchaeia archaeon]
MAIKEGSRLWNKIMTAVRTDGKDNLELLILTEEKLRNYNGRADILENYLQIAGTFNPYLATKNARIVEARWKTSEEEKADIREGKKPAHGDSQSGHTLLDQLFAVLPQHGTELFVSGARAITKIFSTWGSEEQANKFTIKYEKEAEKRRMTAEKKSLSTLDEDIKTYLKDSLLTNKASSAKITSAKQIILENRLKLLYELINGNPGLYDPKSENYIFSSSGEGSLWKWFEKTRDLPEDIMNMYATYKSAVVDIDDNARDKLRTTLILYSARNREVSTNLILFGAKTDIDYYQSLPENHKLKQKISPPKLYKVKNLLEKPKITLEAACEVLEIFDFVKMRKIVNAQTLSRFKDEITPFLDLTRALYVENGEMKEDSIGSSVPWTRVKETEIGKATSRLDHQYLKEFYRMEILTINQERLLKDMPVKQFDDTITHLVIAKRKFDYLGSSEENEPKSKFDHYVKWKEYEAKSDDYDITENFEATHGMKIDEFVHRAEFLKNTLKGARSQLINKASFGLYSPNVIAQLTDILEETKNLTPYTNKLSTINNENSSVFSIVRNENSTVFSNALLVKLNYNTVYKIPEYITLEQKVGIESMPELKKYFDDNKEIADEFMKIKIAKYFDSTSSVLGINDSSYNISDVSVVNEHGATIVTPEVARAQIDEINEKYTPLSKLPDFRKKAYDVFDVRNRHILEQKDYKEIFTGTWHRIKDMTDNSMISNTLVEQINEVHASMFPSRQ